MPELDLFWFYMFLGLVLIILVSATLVIEGTFRVLTALSLDMAWERLRPFVPR